MAIHTSRTPTSPASLLWLKALKELDVVKLNQELALITTGVTQTDLYEFKTHLMRYDFQYNEEYLKAYTDLYATRWATGRERLELGMTPEESYQHWDNVMNFALKNGYIVILLCRPKNSSGEWKFALGSHAFDMADMRLDDYKTLHSASYQPWADMFDELFLAPYDWKPEWFTIQFNNSTCKTKEFNDLPGAVLTAHVYAVVSLSVGYKKSNTIVISPKLQKSYTQKNSRGKIVRNLPFSDVYRCSKEQVILRNLTVSNFEFEFPDAVKIIAAYMRRAKDPSVVARL
eukprot:CAMPEP_0114984868 /NCGR_PEP_ID=MMETSP0216-20121206/7527_1 /TAXON_ID=223996 /ORGANISM="Protocruzia adherens, Strain Boccale" /LENGTH=286 /DNA_ID=CAMNT_0002347075 /DNA_START=504 /DNA_END=1364 /DNA_ORIENTATION=-